MSRMGGTPAMNEGEQERMMDANQRRERERLEGRKEGRKEGE